MDNLSLDLDDLRSVIREEIQRAFQQQQPISPLMDRKNAATYVGVKEQTLAKWAMDGTGPAPTKIGSRSLYRKEILDEYISLNTMPRRKKVQDA